MALEETVGDKKIVRPITSLHDISQEYKNNRPDFVSIYNRYFRNPEDTPDMVEHKFHMQVLRHMINLFEAGSAWGPIIPPKNYEKIINEYDMKKKTEILGMNDKARAMKTAYDYCVNNFDNYQKNVQKWIANPESVKDIKLYISPLYENSEE